MALTCFQIFMKNIFNFFIIKFFNYKINNKKFYFKILLIKNIKKFMITIIK